MLKGREVIHLPVVHPTSGKTLGQVVDLVVDPGKGKILELLIQAYEQPEKSLIPLSQVRVERDAVRTNVELQMFDQESGPKPPSVLYASRLEGHPVITEGGKNLGNIGDLLIDPQQGDVTGLEVTDGLMQDLLTGRIQLPWPDILSWGTESVIVADHWQDAWQREL